MLRQVRIGVGRCFYRAGATKVQVNAWFWVCFFVSGAVLLFQTPVLLIRVAAEAGDAEARDPEVGYNTICYDII